MMGEELANQRRLEMESGEFLPELQLLFTLKPGIDRRYNAQRTKLKLLLFFIQMLMEKFQNHTLQYVIKILKLCKKLVLWIQM